mmetsp:Transcript_3662/g.5413  ORF Transcript_3662/g.5413 Transcript_3662/m.5413 type:complete len:132 (+) Transcript_3662:17-412(+)
MAYGKHKDDNDEPLDFSADSGAVLWGLSSGMITFCKEQQYDYLECKSKDDNPEKCLAEALGVRTCAFELAKLYQNPANGCNIKFAHYVKCLKRHGLRQEPCWDYRVHFENCAAENLGLDFLEPVNLWNLSL